MGFVGAEARCGVCGNTQGKFSALKSPQFVNRADVSYPGVKNNNPERLWFMKPILIFVFALSLSVCAAAAQTSSQSDEGAHVLALDNSWNRALETNDTKALDLLLAESFVSIDVDGSIQTKGEFLASLKAPGYQKPAQAVTEKSKVDVYGDSAVVYGVFRTRSVTKGKVVMRRERFVDTWVNTDRAWKCVASVAVLIPSG
jgi:ketosteroid isomerase-like protein